jgi:hypothetical protein
MRRLTIIAIIFAISAVIFPGAQSAQNSASQAQPTSTTPDKGSDKLGTLLKGKGLVGKLTKGVDTKHTKVGDPVTVEVTQDVKLDGQVLLPKGSLVKGIITKVQPFSKGSNAELDFVFDNVTTKTGEQTSTHLLIYALAAKMDHAPPPEDLGARKGLGGVANSASISGHVGGQNSDELAPETVGIFGFDDLELHPGARPNPPTSSVACAKKNISLESGTHIVLVFAGM